MSDNTRAVIGDNVRSGFGDQVAADMRREYARVALMSENLAAEAASLPETIGTETECLAAGIFVKRARDHCKHLEAVRIAEGAPYLSATQAVNSFFFPLIERLFSRSRGGKPGAADIIQGRIDSYLARKRAAEEERRRREAEETARRAREEAQRAAEASRLAQDAERAAARAREPAKVEAKEAKAQDAAAAAAQAQVAARIAMDEAEAARHAMLAKPADMSRTRGDGVLLTEKREPYAEVVDRNVLDKEALWPFLRSQDIEMALRAWARTTGYEKSMAGASIGFRQKGVTR